MTFHETFRRESSIKTSSDRSFGLIFAVVFTIIATWPLLNDGAPRWWSLAIAGVFFITALVRPGILNPLNRAWSKFGSVLHMVTTPVLIGMIFYFVVTPTSLMLRLFGKIPLPLKFDPAASSYWIDRHPPGPEGDSMKNQY